MRTRHSTRLTLALFAAVALLGGCSGLGIEDTASTGEPLRIEEFFRGQTRAHGVLFDRAGRATRHFQVDLHGHWDAAREELVLDEDFVFDDGELDQRQWRIRRIAPGEYRGRADDVEGEAVGHSRGNALLWRYTLIIPYRGRELAVDLEDWMYLNDGVLINRATLRKFGVKVGELVISFYRPTEPSPGRAQAELAPCGSRKPSCNTAPAASSTRLSSSR